MFKEIKEAWDRLPDGARTQGSFIELCHATQTCMDTQVLSKEEWWAGITGTLLRYAVKSEYSFNKCKEFAQVWAALMQEQTDSAFFYTNSKSMSLLWDTLRR